MRALIMTVLVSLTMLVQTVCAQTILVVGDSISAAYGLDRSQGWVALLEQRLAQAHPSYRVVNASISGDTTAGGVARLPALLEREQPALVLIELGGNDGLRGLPIAQMKRNLSTMTEAALTAGAKVVLLGVYLPPNYGSRYTDAFAAAYRDVAKQQKIPLVPFILEGIGGVDGMMQADGVHPTANAQRRLLDNIWPTVEPLL